MAKIFGSEKGNSQIDSDQFEAALQQQAEILKPFARKVEELGLSLDALAEERKFQRTGVWDETIQPPLPFNE